MLRLRALTAAAAVATLLTLTACGGDDSADGAAEDESSVPGPSENEAETVYWALQALASGDRELACQYFAAQPTRWLDDPDAPGAAEYVPLDSSPEALEYCLTEELDNNFLYVGEDYEKTPEMIAAWAEVPLEEYRVSPQGEDQTNVYVVSADGNELLVEPGRLENDQVKYADNFNWYM